MKGSTENLPRKILKALGIFGGMQGVLILCSLIRVKLIAIFIGSEGVGLFSIFNNAIDMYREVTQLNIQQSAVRDVARNHNEGNIASMAYIVTRWSWILGIAGAFLLLVTSPFLSRYCFGNSDYTYAFAALSVVIFMQAIQAGYLIIMQGTENLTNLVKTQLWGAVISITICAPLYYLWGINSVIPSLIVYVTTNLITTYIFRVKLPRPSRIPTKNDIFSKGKTFIRLGFFLTISSFATLLADFIFKSWLNVTASTIMVGLYTAGFTIVNRYVGMVFTAISVEYYPRLSKIIHSPKDVHIHVSHEINMALLVITPLILFFIPLARFIVSILYSDEFNAIIPFITVAAVGTLYRAVSWCFAFVILAKGDGKVYVITELLSSALFLVINIFTYKTYGLPGMGYAYTVWYMLYFVSTALVYFRLFHFTLSKSSFIYLIIGTLLAVISLIIVYSVHWIAGVVFAVIVSLPYTRKVVKYIRK